MSAAPCRRKRPKRDVLYRDAFMIKTSIGIVSVATALLLGSSLANLSAQTRQGVASKPRH